MQKNPMGFQNVENFIMGFVCRACVWTSLLLCLLALFGACSVISRFTRVAGELFGMLIAVLFMQEAIKVECIFSSCSSSHLCLRMFDRLIYHFSNCFQGVVNEFRVPEHENPREDQYQFPWLFSNGLYGLILSLGLLITALKSRRARSWRYCTGNLFHHFALYS